VYPAGGDLAFAHRLDNRGAAVAGVAGCEHPGHTGRTRGRVDDDRIPVELEAADRAEELGARPLADRLDNRVGAEDELRAGNLLRPPPTVAMTGSWKARPKSRLDELIVSFGCVAEEPSSPTVIVPAPIPAVWRSDRIWL